MKAQVIPSLYQTINLPLNEDAAKWLPGFLSSTNSGLSYIRNLTFVHCASTQPDLLRHRAGFMHTHTITDFVVDMVVQGLAVNQLLGLK